MSKLKETKETSEERTARLEAKLQRLHAQSNGNGNGDHKEEFEGFDDDEVTDVIDLALRKLEKASETVSNTVRQATNEISIACEVARRPRRQTRP